MGKTPIGDRHIPKLPRRRLLLQGRLTGRRVADIRGCAAIRSCAPPPAMKKMSLSEQYLAFIEGLEACSKLIPSDDEKEDPENAAAWGKEYVEVKVRSAAVSGKIGVNRRRSETSGRARQTGSGVSRAAGVSGAIVGVR